MPNIFALSLGVVSILLFGVGMCCWLVWTAYKILGTLLCIIGAELAAANVPLRARWVSARKDRLAPQIIP